MTPTGRGIAIGSAALAIAIGCYGVISEPTATGIDPGATTGSGIALVPPAGVGQLALQCEPDHAPLRRLNHIEYQNTLSELFGDALPSIRVAPDARRSGFTNNYQDLSPSSLLVTQYYENSAAIAAAAAPGLIGELGCGMDEACFRTWVSDFGRRAYRRPLTDAEVDSFVGYFTSGAAAGNFALAMEMALINFLQAPSFIYRPEFGGSDDKLSQDEIANRLSYFIWASMPDEALLEAAANRELVGDALAAQVDRMLRDDRAQRGLMNATAEWLLLGRLADRLKGEQYDAIWTAEVRADLRRSIEMFIWERVFSEDGSLEALMTAHGAYVNSRIGPLFGIDDAGEELEWRELPDRSGILTHPAILATHAHGTIGSPVLRGVFILNEILCDPPSPPPPGAGMTEPEIQTDDGTPITNRDGWEQLTESDPTCATCHRQINPLGFAFEHYDAVGAYRSEDSGYPIDSSGYTEGFTLNEELEFEDANDLTAQLGTDQRVRACIVDRWVRYATGGGALAYDPCLREELEAIANQPGMSLRDVVVAIALHPKFVSAEVVE